jgi:hypothetical protein
MSALLITGSRALFKEIVLTPRGKDMNPELGPVVAVPPKTSYHISMPGATVLYKKSPLTQCQRAAWRYHEGQGDWSFELTFKIRIILIRNGGVVNFFRVGWGNKKGRTDDSLP